MLLPLHARRSQLTRARAAVPPCKSGWPRSI
jgi:hypothetical protein